MSRLRRSGVINICSDVVWKLEVRKRINWQALIVIVIGFGGIR